ncbi:integrin beta-like protein 1 isoform X1 [Macrobrachium nipponense]|uniref:integrin beta-like protein 1 isoform X1 n=1 Tax=Macrobrachium nipponense TaxID=159736 RepID=UPI0030C86CC2
MVLMQRLFLLLLATVAFAKHATTEEQLEENAIAGEDVSVEDATAEEETSAENTIAEEEPLVENAIAEEPLEENVIAEEEALAENVMTEEPIAENGTAEENVSKGIDASMMKLFGNETNGTMSYEEFEAKTFCGNKVNDCHKSGGVCMTSHGIKSFGSSGSHCSSTKTFSSGNCQTCHCCIGMRCSQTKACQDCGGKCDNKCSTIQRPYDNLCGHGSCLCCLSPCENSPACQAKGGRCMDDRIVCGGYATKDCAGAFCKCCVNPPPLTKPPPKPEVCHTTSECKHKGGYCCGRAHCTSGHFVKRHCSGGYDCGCCIDRPVPEVCKTTSECKHKGGYCCGRAHCTSGHFVKRHCSGGHDCGCCIDRPVPEVCKTTSECKHKGGYCCGREHCTSGHFVKRHCSGGRDCGCCLDKPEPPHPSTCQEERSCTRAQGKCKSRCRSEESEIHGGCRGSGCKCCAPKSHPSPYGH